MLVPAFVLADLLLLRVSWKRLWRRHWPAPLLVAGWFWLTHAWLARSVGGAVRPMREQILTQAKAFGWYAHKLAMPVHLNVEPQFQVSPEPTAAVALAGIGALSLAWVVLRSAGRRDLFLCGLAALWALPTTLMPLNVLLNERRAYMLVAVACVAVGVMWRRA